MRKVWRLCAATAAGATIVWTAAVRGTAATTFQIDARDHICIIGNTLAERMQYDGWLETLIQARFPEHELVFRNLGFSGDEIATRLRSKNFGTPDEWLSGLAEAIGGYEENRLETANTRADVVFAFFGYNESHAGQAGLEKFRHELGEWIQHTLRQRYNRRSAPRLVVFSPVAHEDLGNPDLPDGRENNARLELYTKAMAEVAKVHGVFFVDLFTPSRELYAANDAPLTINGIHLNALGNRLIAQAIDRALFGGPAPRAAGSLEPLRQAVVEKNFLWFNRYRVTDGYATYGDRAFLTFHRDSPRHLDPDQLAKARDEGFLPTNYEVLQRELPVLDVMTSNRDRRIWALARGSDLQIDDSNTPPFIDARTNLPGKGPAGTHLFLDGEAAVDRMTVGEGLQVNLFASEKEFPELVNPVQMAFDTRGRLWVAAWKNYPHWQPKTPMDDKLLILEDTDGDGKADKRTVFAGDLNNPTGFEFYNGGVILAQQPNLLFLKDTDGDDRYDLKEIILHGFDSADTHHAINSFTFDPGGALYMQEGVFHRTQVETPWGPVVRQADGGVYRFEPRTWKFETYIPMNFPNPHGHVFDYWGRDIVFDATGGQPYYGPSFSTKKYYPAMETRNAPRPGTVRTRPVGGVELLSSRHFPETLQGNLIVLNVIGFRGLLNYKLSEDGAGLQMSEVDPILNSADENFRPVDAEVGPDGALYFVDWHNPIIGHMQHNLRDRSRDKLHGRVYRVTWRGRPLLTPPRIAGQPIPALLELLEEQEDRVRYRAKIELSARDTKDVLAALDTWMNGLDAKGPNYEHHMMEALWVHQWHNRVNERLLARMLRSSEPWARAAATRVLCYWRDRVADPLALLKAQMDDPHPAVRLEAVRAVSFFQTEDAVRVALASLNHPQDRFLEYTLDRTMDTLDAFLPPGLLFDVSPRAIDYQLGRLSNPELVRLERRADDVKYRPVYYALLTRKGLGREHFDEALTVLMQLDNASRTRVLLEGLAKVRADDAESAARLLQVLLAQPPDALRADRTVLAKTLEGPGSPLSLRGAYGAMIVADADPRPAWQAARKRQGHLVELLRAVPHLPSAAPAAIAAELSSLSAAALAETQDPATRIAALSALAWARPDSATFTLLAREVQQRTDADTRAAAIRALHTIPRDAWPEAGVLPLAQAIVAIVGQAPPAQRASPAVLDAMQLGEKLADALPAESRRAVRRDLRGLGVQVVRIQTVPEQMAFDLKWFAVEAGRQVQIVLYNPDAMPHNLLVSQPGSLEAVGTAAATMPVSADPNAKPYVPDSPLVLHATRLLNWGETDRLSFAAPTEPGEYIYVCTFPGHWVRMYGVMLVVKDLETFEASPAAPIDPMTKKPFASQRE